MKTLRDCFGDTAEQDMNGTSVTARVVERLSKPTVKDVIDDACRKYTDLNIKPCGSGIAFARGKIIPDKLECNLTNLIDKVIFNDPATIILWKDGTKTVVKCSEDDTYNPEMGMAMAIAKKALGNKGNYCKVFKKWLPEEEETDFLTSFEEVKSRLQEIIYNIFGMGGYHEED